MKNCLEKATLFHSNFHGWCARGQLSDAEMTTARYADVNMCTSVRMCVCACVHVCVCACMRACVHACAHVGVWVCGICMHMHKFVSTVFWFFAL